MTVTPAAGAPAIDPPSGEPTTARFVDQGRQIAERMYEAFNGRDAEAAKGLFSSNFYSHPLKASGWECVQRAWQRMWDQPPGLMVSLEDVVVENQRVATRTEMVGFADGSTVTMLEMFTFQDDRIVELWGLSSRPQEPTPK